MTRLAESAEVREALARALRLDLIGPWAGHPLADERLRGWERPSNRYLTGFLVPRGAPVEQRGDVDAHVFGSGWIMRTDTGFYVADGILCVEATRAGLPAFTFETGEGGNAGAALSAGGEKARLR